MSEAKDTLLRLFSLLRLIPTKSQSVVTPTLLEKLNGSGFSVALSLSSVTWRGLRFIFPSSTMTTGLLIAVASRDTLFDLSDMDAFIAFDADFP